MAGLDPAPTRKVSTMPHRSLTALALLALLAATPALAAGSSSDTASAPAAADPWTARWGDLGAAYQAAVEQAKAGQYAEAIAALTALGKMEDPRVLNWLGFATRKMGKPQEALAFYDKALTIAPDFTPAREYRGEAYIQLKDLDKARAELAEIEKLCGNQTCEEYTDLAEDLAKAGS